MEEAECYVLKDMEEIKSAIIAQSQLSLHCMVVHLLTFKYPQPVQYSDLNI